MDKLSNLFGSRLRVVNVGSEIFADALRRQGADVIQVDWHIPCGGSDDLVAILTRIRTQQIVHNRRRLLLQDLIDQANQKAVDILNASHPMLLGVARALDVIPGMETNLILHAGPPVDWEHMCGPMRGAVIGALIYEGLADDEDKAGRLAASGKIRFEPCHHHSTVGPMAGVVSASMPVWIVENRYNGNRAYCTLNEGLGKVLRYGAFSEDVINRLKWIEKVLAPTLAEAIKLHGEIDLRTIIAQALQMGDEGHNRNKAGTSLLIRELAPAIALVKTSNSTKSDVMQFMHGNDHFFLNLTMPAAKASLDSIRGIKYCSVLTAMARNGTEFGIRVSALGERWFTAPAPHVKGLYFPGFSDNDANPDIGDSTICETYGIGGFAMAAAPAIVEFVGGTSQDAVNFTLRMYEITAGESSNHRIPFLGFRGTPTAIDLTKVVEKNIVPVVNTGIAHRKPGIGQVGAGLVEPPMKCFEDAFRAFYDEIAEA